MKALNSLLRQRALAVAAAMLAAVPASAQPTPIEVAADATWRHDTAEVRFPPEIDGFRRTRVQDFGDQRFDVAATYHDQASATTTTVYLFRAPLPDVSLWHDRALVSIRPHETLGTPDHAAAMTQAFAPPGTEIASGLMTVLPLSGRVARSTALAVLPQGRWLIKVRMTSNRLDTAQLGAQMAAFLAALPIDPPETARPAATAMADCSGGFAFSNAERADRLSMAVRLELAITGDLGDGIAEEREAQGIASPAWQASAPFCRDAASQPDYGVYRRVGESDRYVMGFGDAGLSATVGRRAISVETDQGSDKIFWVSFADPYKTSFYRGFETLPSPAQAIGVINDEQPLASIERKASGDSNISVTPD